MVDCFDNAATALPALLKITAAMFAWSHSPHPTFPLRLNFGIGHYVVFCFVQKLLERWFGCVWFIGHVLLSLNGNVAASPAQVIPIISHPDRATGSHSEGLKPQPTNTVPPIKTAAVTIAANTRL